jgi:hypothetical protein
MPKKTLPRIASVAATPEPLVLTITWQSGDVTTVDVSGPVTSFRVYTPLRDNPALFAQVRVGDHGTDIVWTDEIDMAATTLWRLAQEQVGNAMTAEAFRKWRARRAYTLEGAARALGLSRRMVAYYDQGEKPIPRVVALATKALELT